MANLSNTTISDTGSVKFSVGTTSERTTPVTGAIRYNSTLAIFEYYTGSQWISADSKEDSKDLLGASSSRPALSGWDLVRRRPGVTNGYYWIQSLTMRNPLQMYVDTIEDGGGYDFYVITGGINTNDIRNANSARNLGMDLVMPRSPGHWRAMSNFTNNVLSSSIENYFQGYVGPIYRITSTGSGTAGGNYTGQVMRSTLGYGSGAQDWQVPDGGRWWLRGSTYSEPNGDYGSFGYLARRSIPNPYNTGDITYNDGGNASSRPYYTGTQYIGSTNAKP